MRRKVRAARARSTRGRRGRRRDPAPDDHDLRPSRSRYLRGRHCHQRAFRADYATAITAYGSVDGFARALSDRGLGVVSGYFGDLEHAVSLDTAAEAEIIARARRRRCGEPARSRDPGGRDPGRAAHREPLDVLDPRDIDLFMLLTDPMYVAMCPDTGHIALAGADPAQVMSRHRDRLVIAHWEDASGPVPLGLPIDEDIFERQAAYFRRAGTGVVDWFGWSRLLQEIGYSGCTLLELDAVADPVTEMALAREFVTTALSRFYPRPADPHLRCQAARTR